MRLFNQYTDRMPSLKIATWNLRGYSSSVPYLRELCANNDVILISEHWLHRNKLCKLEEISADMLYCARASNFSTEESYGTRRGQGGVAVLWKRHLGGVSEIKDICHDRFCGIRLQTDKGVVINIISTYLPCRGSPEDYGSCIDDLSEFLDSREAGSLSIIGGDMNGDLGKLCGSRSDRNPSKQGVLLHKLIEKFNLHVANLSAPLQGQWILM